MKVVFFDLFGTLVDITEKSWPYKQAIMSSSINPLTLKKRGREAQTLNIGFNEFCSQINTKSNTQQLIAALEQELNSIEVFPDTLATLKSLKGSGYKIGICSNLAQPYEHALTLISDLIDFSVLSFEVGYMKPDKGIYKIVHEKAGCSKDEILFVGDTLLADVKAPQKFGLKSIHLDRKIKNPAPKKINNLTQLRRYIKSS